MERTVLNILVFLYVIFLLVGTAYLVYWKEASGWLWILTLILLSRIGSTKSDPPEN